MIVINKIVICMYCHKNLHGALLLGHPVLRKTNINWSLVVLFQIRFYRFSICCRWCRKWYWFLHL